MGGSSRCSRTGSCREATRSKIGGRPCNSTNLWGRKSLILGWILSVWIRERRDDHFSLSKYWSFCLDTIRDAWGESCLYPTWAQCWSHEAPYCAETKKIFCSLCRGSHHWSGLVVEAQAIKEVQYSTWLTEGLIPNPSDWLARRCNSWTCQVTFMDAYRGHHEIFMDEGDLEKNCIHHPPMPYIATDSCPSAWKMLALCIKV